MSIIGSSFASELVAAGLGGIAVTWNEDGIFDPYAGMSAEDKTAFSPPLVSPMDALDPATRAKLVTVLATHDPTKAAPPVVPSSASKLGIKLAMSAMGLWPQAKAAIAANADLQEDWDLAASIQRSDALTQGLIASLQLTDAQVDQILVQAAVLTG